MARLCHGPTVKKGTLCDRSEPCVRSSDIAKQPLGGQSTPTPIPQFLLDATCLQAYRQTKKAL